METSVSSSCRVLLSVAELCWDQQRRDNQVLLKVPCQDCSPPPTVNLSTMEVSTEAKLGLIMPAHPPSGNWHYQFRILLLGDSTVGKTSLLRRYTERCFIPTPCPTVGVEFYSKMMELPPGIKVKLQLWDTAGQERFR